MAAAAAACRFTLLVAAVLAPAAAAAGLGFDFHHRFSDRVRQWAEARAVPGTWWPEKGTVEYYDALVHHDRVLHGRSLAEADSSEPLTFVSGNATYRFNSLGFLHYALVSLGKPNVTFLVALDTGSDLFWVPCDCRQCSTPEVTNLKLETYSPSNSSTSEKVFCSDDLCDQQNACTSATSSCPYNINYLSANTSSSGVLVQDILYLTTEDANPKTVEAPIVFGCGDYQTGSFLDGAAPNGLFGLGREKVSVPSILASKGLISDSFSMCFGYGVIGRINFGDKGSSDQQETAFITNKRHPTYRINITGITVGENSTNMAFSAIVDSGTSFTTLADPMYSFITERFNAQVQEKRFVSNLNSTFEYCYELSPNQESILFPDINLTTLGGSVFPVKLPIVLISSQTKDLYCLALLKFNTINIIGQNFLTGYRVVFDRERLVLGWKDSDCYTAENSSTLSVQKPSSTVAPAPSSLAQEKTKSGEKTARAPATSPSSSTSSRLKTMSILSLALLMFSQAFF